MFKDDTFFRRVEPNLFDSSVRVADMNGAGALLPHSVAFRSQILLSCIHLMIGQALATNPGVSA